MSNPALNITTRVLAIACMTTVAVPTAWSEDREPAPIPKRSRMLGHLVRPTLRSRCKPL